MEVGSSAGYASAVNVLQTRSQLQTGQLKQNADQEQQAAQVLQAGTTPGTETGGGASGRGALVDIKA